MRAVALLTALLSAASAVAQIDLPQPDGDQAVVITAEAANRWTQGSYEVWLLRGNCRIVHGTGSARSTEAVLWIDHAAAGTRQRSKVIAYLEGDVVIETAGRQNPIKLSDESWLGRFFTGQEVRVHVGRVAGKPDVEPEIFRRGMARRRPAPAGPVRPAQFAELLAEPAAEGAMPPGSRRIEIHPRSSVPVQVRWDPDPNSEQWIGMVDGGVMMYVYRGGEFGVIDISADRLVIWTTGLQEPDITGKQLQDGNVPMEVYMEGNIVFRQGDRVIYAERMYYDVTNRTGTVLEAEVLTPVPNYQGLLRLRADVLQQTGEGRFFARNAFITSSRMGEPGYRVQSGDIYYEDVQIPAVDPITGQPVLDPVTNEQVIDHRRLATSQNNFLFFGQIPIFYWPTLATDLEDPTFYIRRVRLKNDRVFGTQVLTNWDAYELLGIRRPPAGTDWDVTLDYLSERGLGHGTTLLYHRDGFLGIPGRTAGLIDAWGIKDDGLDDLGAGRRGLVPEKDYRFRLFWQHRQRLAGDFQLTAELGWISDRNFLEEYYKREWDELKDQTTGLELKRIRDNTSWSITVDGRLNEFFTQTEWLPRGDHFWLGQSLLGDRLTWYEHTQVGYARLRPAAPPDNLADAPWRPLPYERDTAGNPVEGEVFITRHELDYPFQAGPVKLVPYLLSEFSHWGEDRTGNDLQRFYYQAGMRASLPMWKADPAAESQLLNVHGLAHKVVFDAELSFAEANRNLGALPLYDPIDDDSIEAFRRRFVDTTFGGVLPPQFDPRLYAVRTGLGGWVTSPSPEIAEDLIALRMGVRQRWQTKRGMPGNRRIIDWITLDTNFTWFPENGRDNFGEALGLFDYDFRWHVGDRLTLLSDGALDFFHDGQQLVTVGGYLSRPPRGNLYLGLRLLEGPISSRVLAASYSYRMSPKWISSYGTSIDLKGDGNIGHRFAITRIGESLLFSAGFHYNAARDNIGVNFAIEPRFLPSGRLGNVGGARIPVAGAFGLE